MSKIKYLVYALMGLLFVSLVFLVFALGYTSIKDISSQRFQAKIDEFEKNEKEMLSLEMLHKEWQNIDQSYQSFKDTYILKFNDLARFRNNLFAMIGQNYLERISSYMEYEKIKGVDIERTRFDLKLKGRYKDLKHFIHDIENLKHLVIFKNLTLSKAGSDGRGNFVLEVYHVK